VSVVRRGVGADEWGMLAAGERDGLTIGPRVSAARQNCQVGSGEIKEFYIFYFVSHKHRNGCSRLHKNLRKWRLEHLKQLLLLSLCPNLNRI
jgi:hypothetical protein